MNVQIKQKIEKSYMKPRPNVQVGDVVKLHMKIKEGDKSRIQIFQGMVIAIKGDGLGKMITVRKISNGIGVERMVPLHSPNLEKIEIVKRGKVRRSKLYYMRQRIGKAATRIRGLREFFDSDELAQQGDDTDENAAVNAENTEVEDVPADADADQSASPEETDKESEAVEATETKEIAEDNKTAEASEDAGTADEPEVSQADNEKSEDTTA